VDLLPDRTAPTLITWLKQHPQIEILARDRSTEYARAAGEGAPQAQQVADRFHRLCNVRTALRPGVERPHPALRGMVVPRAKSGENEPTPPLQTRLPEKRSPAEEAKRQQREARRPSLHQQIHQLKAQGQSLLGIAGQLQIPRTTVYRSLRVTQTSATGRIHRYPSALHDLSSYYEKPFPLVDTRAMRWSR
jgi:Transposase